MDMETVKLSQIVEKLAPELSPFLTEREMDISIVLRDGLELLEPADAMEIVQHSICNQQREALLQ
jgi:two-component sensor histidine kinase